MIDVSWIAFWIVALAFLLLGIRNVLWSIERERSRLKTRIERGLRYSAIVGGARALLLGALMILAARYLALALAWLVLGATVSLLGIFIIVLSSFFSFPMPPPGQSPESNWLAMRVKRQRFGGIVFLTIAGLWAWDGAAILL